MYYYSIQFLFLFFSFFFVICQLSLVETKIFFAFFLCVICISTVTTYYYIIKTHAQKGRQRRDGEEMMEKMWKRRRSVLYECKKAKGLLPYVLTYVLWIFFELSGQTQFS